MSYKIVETIILIAIFAILVIGALKFRKGEKEKEKIKNKRKHEVSELLKIEKINILENRKYLKTIEVIVVLPESEECCIKVTDDIYERKNHIYYNNGYQPTFKSLGPQVVIENNGTIKKISQKFEIKSTTRTKICAGIKDDYTKFPEITALIQPD